MATGSNDGFPATEWSVIRAAKDRDGAEYYLAMNCLIAGYWRPVFYFLRVKGYTFHQAEDLTQDFFLNLVDRGWISRADPARGKFRTFLLSILVRFLSDRGPKRAPKQRQFDERVVSISSLVRDEERTFDPPSGETPEAIFTRQWARATVENVLRKLATWCEERDHAIWYQIFSTIHFPPPGIDKVAHTSLATQLGISRDQVRYALEQTNQKFVELLRAEVADQVDSEAEVDEELRWLEELL